VLDHAVYQANFRNCSRLSQAGYPTPYFFSDYLDWIPSNFSSGPRIILCIIQFTFIYVVPDWLPGWSVKALQDEYTVENLLSTELSCPEFSSDYHLACRSTPCPNVKQGDEWGDPSKCENGDTCGYCHTRTEQQFHLEVCTSTFISVTRVTFAVSTLLQFDLCVACSVMVRALHLWSTGQGFKLR